MRHLRGQVLDLRLRPGSHPVAAAAGTVGRGPGEQRWHRVKGSEFGGKILLNSQKMFNVEGQKPRKGKSAHFLPYSAMPNMSKNGHGPFAPEF
jgi:hypothetical protein